MAEFNTYPSLNYNPTDFNQIPLSNELLKAQQNRNALFPLQQDALRQQNEAQGQSNALGALGVRQATTADASQQILQAAEQVDDDDPNAASKAWDEHFQALDSAGVKGAKQWIGRYSIKNKDTIRSMYSAPVAPMGRGASSALPGMAGPGLGGGGPQSALAPSQQYDLNAMGPEQVTQNLQKAQTVVSEIDRVFAAGANAPQVWAEIQAQDPQAATLGPFDPQRLAKVRQGAVQMQDQLTQRAQQASVGLAPRNTPDIIHGPQGEISAVDAFAPGGPKATKLQEQNRPPLNPNFQHIGDTAAGLPILLDTTTGKTSIGDTPIKTDQFNKTGTDDSDVAASDFANTDPESDSILKVTGLSLPAYSMITGKSSARWDKNTRNQANKDVKEFTDKNGVDVSTLQSQFEGLNNVLKGNITRVNQTKLMEGELLGTLDNLKPVIEAAKLGKLQPANVAEAWGGQKINNPTIQQYSFYIGQLRNELAGYYAALKNKAPGQIDDKDQKDAEATILSGIDNRAAGGLRTAIEASVHKMNGVFEQSVDRSRQGVWDLFGVGDKFKPKYSPAASEGYKQAPDGNFYRPAAGGKFEMWRPK